MLKKEFALRLILWHFQEIALKSLHFRTPVLEKYNTKITVYDRDKAAEYKVCFEMMPRIIL